MPESKTGESMIDQRSDPLATEALIKTLEAVKRIR
jgi:hypothetical protein